MSGCSACRSEGDTAEIVQISSLRRRSELRVTCLPGIVHEAAVLVFSILRRASRGLVSRIDIDRRPWTNCHAYNQGVFVRPIEVQQVSTHDDIADGRKRFRFRLVHIVAVSEIERSHRHQDTRIRGVPMGWMPKPGRIEERIRECNSSLVTAALQQLITGAVRCDLLPGNGIDVPISCLIVIAPSLEFIRVCCLAFTFSNAFTPATRFLCCNRCFSLSRSN